MESSVEKILGLISRMVVPYVVPTLIEKCDFFNKFNQVGPGDLMSLTKNFSFNERVFEAVLNYLVKEKYLEKTLQNGSYIFSLSNCSKEFLLKESKYDFSNYAILFNAIVPDKISNSIMSALQTGRPAKWDADDNWEDQMKKGVISKNFSLGMMSRGNYLKDRLSESLSNTLINYKKFIDVGGSLGDFCGKFAGDYKNLECTVFDVPGVIEHAKNNIAEKKYERVSVLSGDMFKEIPSGFDVYFYSNTIHDWDNKQIDILFRKTHSALENNGVIIVHDCHLENEKISPSYAVDHAVFLSIFTNGRYYSYAEIENMLKNVGFKKTEVIKTIAGFSAILGYKN